MSAWNESEAPKDGKPIVAVGGVMIHDEFSVTKEPFCAAIWWDEKEQEWRLWHGSDQLTVRRALDDEVIIHYWMPYP